MATKRKKAAEPEAKLVTGYLDIFISPDGKESAVRLAVRGEVACWCELDREQAFKIAHQLLGKAIELEGRKASPLIELQAQTVFKLPVDV